VRLGECHSESVVVEVKTIMVVMIVCSTRSHDYFELEGKADLGDSGRINKFIKNLTRRVDKLSVEQR
jgi:hypothetical protein